MTTRLVSSFTAHNVSNSPTYSQANQPSLFTGTSTKDGVNFAVDPNLMDDSQNAASPMVISKESVRTLMPPTWNGRICQHGQFWWGNASHPNIGYSNTNSTDMANIIADIASRGIDVVIPDWYGASVSGAANDTVVDLIFANLAANGLKCAVMIDEQFLADNGYVTATFQQGAIDAINHIANRYFSDPNYEHYTLGGVSRPLILLWNWVAVVGSNVNWTTVKANVTGNPIIIQYQASGFGVTASDGALAWLDPNADNNSGVASGVTYLTKSFLPAVSSHQSQVGISSVIKGFNGTLTRNVNWSLNKWIDQQDGQTWLDWWSANSNFVSTGKRLDYVAIVDWDDFEEGSAMQCGIRTNINVLAGQQTSTQLIFSVTGNENTVRQYNLWGTTDGVTATLLDTIPTGHSKKFDLTRQIGLPPGVYTLYIEAQGMPGLQSHTLQFGQLTTMQVVVGGNVGGNISGHTPGESLNTTVLDILFKHH